MNYQFPAVLASMLLVAACDSSEEISPEEASGSTYEVTVTDQKIVFRGIDQQRIIADLPGDKFEDNVAAGRLNMSKLARMSTEADRALEKLRSHVREADTAVLLRSIRTGYQGKIDYRVARGGNLIIGAELASRMPIPEGLVPESDATDGFEVFLGEQRPSFEDFESFLRYAQRYEEPPTQ